MHGRPHPVLIISNQDFHKTVPAGQEFRSGWLHLLLFWLTNHYRTASKTFLAIPILKILMMCSQLNLEFLFNQKSAHIGNDFVIPKTKISFLNFSLNEKINSGTENLYQSASAVIH
jgi:hypothetical protein